MNDVLGRCAGEKPRFQLGVAVSNGILDDGNGRLAVADPAARVFFVEQALHRQGHAGSQLPLGSVRISWPVSVTRDRVLPLGRQAVIPGDDRPVVGQQPGFVVSGIDHRFDGEGHTGFEYQAGSRPAVVQDLGLLVEHPSDPVAAILPHHRETVGFGVLLYDMSDITELGAGFDGLDAHHHAVVGHLGQPAGQHRRVLDEEGPAGVAVVLVLDNGDIDIDDIAAFQLLFPRNAMTDNVIDGRADGFGKTPVVQRRRDAVEFVDDEVVTDIVQFAGRDAGADVGFDHHQDVRREPTRGSHFFDLLGRFDADIHVRVWISHGRYGMSGPVKRAPDVSIECLFVGISPDADGGAAPGAATVAAIGAIG